MTTKKSSQNRKATIVGVASVVGLAVILGAFHSQVTRAGQALTFVVPVVGAAVVGGRRAAYAVAAAATVAFSMVVPPVGTMRVRLAEDLVALVVFSIVAVAVSTVVSRRIELLGAVDRQRTALLRSVSHDLRTPLAAIRAAASDLAAFDELPPATAKRFGGVIEEEAARLDRLVGNLLSLSRIEAGAFTRRVQSVDVDELVTSVVDRFRRLFASAVLDLEIDGTLGTVQGDFTQLDQLLANLIENALRHSPPGGTVTVRARRAGAVVVLAVSDQGPGVEPDVAATLFEPFASGRIPGVSGIGLAICKAVAEAHNGTITVGGNPDGGAVFTVTIK